MAKLIIFILSLFALSVNAQSYDSWEIYQNRKEVSKFNNKKETNDEKKVVLLNRFLEGPGFFVIEYTPAAEQAEWIRTIAFYDSTDKQIRERASGDQLKRLKEARKSYKEEVMECVRHSAW